MKGIHLFTINNIPVGLSPWFLLLLLLLSSTAESFAHGAIFAAVATFSLLIHEFGHAIFAKKYKLEPSIVLHAWGGITLHKPTFDNKKSAIITAAGPTSGLLTGIIFFIIQLILVATLGNEWMQRRPLLLTFFNYMLWVNFVWSLFNLIPIFPLDGGQLLGIALQAKLPPLKAAKLLNIVSLIFCALLIVAAIVFKLVFIAFFALFMGYSNFTALRTFSKKKLLIDENHGDTYLQFEKIAQLKASEHKWQELKDLGFIMLSMATNEQQKKRAYEIYVIALTNLGEYNMAYKLIPDAADTDSIRQAKQRCITQLGLSERDNNTDQTHE